MHIIIAGLLGDGALHGFTHAMRVRRIDARVTQESSNQNISGGHMNWDQIEGKWKEMKGQLREKWGNLTEDDLEMIAGRRDQLIGRLQIRYGIANEEASRQVDEFVSSLKPKVKMMKRVAHH